MEELVVEGWRGKGRGKLKGLLVLRALRVRDLHYIF